MDIKAYDKSFKASVKKLEGAEAIVRETLRELSRSTLEALFEHENIIYVNKLVQAKMTPVNRKALLLYFKHFTGFNFSEEKNEFVKKNKATFEDKKAAALEFLSDPLNNFWVWADRNVEVEAKPLDLKRVSKFIERTLKKANEDGIKQADVIKAILEGGLDMETLMTVLDEAVEHEQA